MTPDELDAEKACVGIAIAHPASLLDMDLRADDFHDPRLGALWGLIVDMDAKREAITPATVLAESTKLPVRIDGPFIFDTYASRPLPALAAKYASIVTNNAGLRRLRMAAQRINQLVDGGGSAHEVAETVRAEIDASHRGVAAGALIGETIDDTLDSLDKPARSMPTPWPDLNRLIRGWRPGALYVIGARPSVGKTLIGLQAALGLCEYGYVALSSLEMPRREIEARVIAQMARVPLGRLEGTGEGFEPLSKQDWDRINAVGNRIRSLTLAIDDRSDITVLDVRSHARTITRRGRLAGVVVDYLQLINNPRGDRRPRHEIVADYSRSLKILAKELDCPVIALSQLNRASETRQDKRPILADLRESGAVEQDADVVILLHSPDPKPGDDLQMPDLDLLVAKNRHGVMGTVQLTRNGAFAVAEPRRWVPHRAAYPN